MSNNANNNSPLSIEDALLQVDGASSASSQNETVAQDISATTFNPEIMNDGETVAEEKKDEKPVKSKESKPKSSSSKKSSSSSKGSAEKVEEITPLTDGKVAENTSAEDAKSDAKPAKKSSSKKSSKKEETKEENLEEKIEFSEKIKNKLSPEYNYKLLKILVIILSVLASAVSIYVYIFHIYDLDTPFDFVKLIPIIPFICQVLLLLIMLLVAGTSERKPIGSAIKENIQTRQEEKEKEADAKVTKEIQDTLLVPEINLEPKKNVELSNFQIDAFYKKNIEEINGKYYMQVAKFDDSIKTYTALGATDMELCAVNMVGSAKFDEILSQPRTKTLNAEELAKYCMSKPQSYTIKKRGAIDWTFKYNSKSFAIVRENDGSYKTSIKCYPDAATRINDVYMALEDSNFPSGPLWYCFNELRNLPPRVCKYLVDTSCQISQFQQTKTDKLKENTKKAKDFDIDMHDIGMKFKAGEKVIKFPKFTMIFTKGEDADLTTFLTREYPGVDASEYTKEYYYKCVKTDDAISILCPTKGVQEEAIIAIFNEIEKAIK